MSFTDAIYLAQILLCVAAVPVLRLRTVKRQERQG